MSASPAQFDANRQNAQKSTGPKTDEGKAASSRNAVKHGLYAADLILNSPHLKEDKAEYDSLVASLMDDLNAQGTFQQQLVVTIAISLWRLRRVINAETAYINNDLNDDTIYQRTESGLRDRTLTPEITYRLQLWSVPYGNSANNFARYESRLNRQITNAFRMLQSLQKTASLTKRTQSPHLSTYAETNPIPVAPCETNPIPPSCHPRQSESPVPHGKNDKTNPIAPPSTEPAASTPYDDLLDRLQRFENEPNYQEILEKQLSMSHDPFLREAIEMELKRLVSAVTTERSAAIDA
jgi:hypothetical protein